MIFFHIAQTNRLLIYYVTHVNWNFLFLHLKVMVKFFEQLINNIPQALDLLFTTLNFPRTFLLFKEPKFGYLARAVSSFLSIIPSALLPVWVYHVPRPCIFALLHISLLKWREDILPCVSTPPPLSLPSPSLDRYSTYVAAQVRSRMTTKYGRSNGSFHRVLACSAGGLSSIPRWDATFSDALCKGCSWLWSSLYIVVTPTWCAILTQWYAFGRISMCRSHATEFSHNPPSWRGGEL
jgi:hypothetical protein